MIESILGSVIFEAIGAFARWTFVSIRNRIKGKPTLPFGQVWKGRKRGLQESVEYGVPNILLGAGIVVLIIILLMWVGL